MLNPLLIVSPTIVTITFVPFVLLIGFGIEHLVRSWYRMFPNNPYARLAGLLPLGVLVSGMVYTGLERYVYGYLYSPDFAASFSRDLSLVNDTARSSSTASIRLVVSDSERPFYDVVAAHSDRITITSATNITDEPLVYTRAAYKAWTPAAAPSRIITSEARDNADRLYLYQSTDE